MDRKHFLSSIVTAGSILPAWGFANQDPDDADSNLILPRYLAPGDVIGITCPAGFITLLDIQPAIQQMESWGLKIRVGNTIGKRDYTFGGTDEERVSDMQDMLDDRSINAIMCARGGYGTVRIIDKLNFSQLTLHPKWVVGFSDVTALHSHLNRNFGIASLHSKMCNSFPDDWSRAEPIQMETILSIKKALFGEKMTYNVAPHEMNKIGMGEGVLVGGNLKTLESLAGSKSDIKTAGKILFVEDTGEYLYSIDRMFWNLKRSGKLFQLKGLVVGGFKNKPDDPGEEFGKTLQDIVLEKIKEYNYPVCFDFPVGHQKNNFALKCGVKHALKVKQDACTLTETR